jgi:hypothetical protein
MWWWWFFTCVHNCAQIFWFTCKNINNAKMGFKNQINIFLDDYFFHMWPRFKVTKCEPSKCFLKTKWYNKRIISLATICFKISRFWNFHMIYCFIKLTQWTYSCIKGIMWFSCTIFLKSIASFYSLFFIFS